MTKNTQLSPQMTYTNTPEFTPLSTDLTSDPSVGPQPGFATYHLISYNLLNNKNNRNDTDNIPNLNLNDTVEHPNNIIFNHYSLFRATEPQSSTTIFQFLTQKNEILFNK
jgi:hypothetical protein